MVAAIVLDIGRLKIVRLTSRVEARDVSEKTRRFFFAFGGEGKVSFTLCSATLA
jgi:hypothetical protein